MATYIPAPYDPMQQAIMSLGAALGQRIGDTTLPNLLGGYTKADKQRMDNQNMLDMLALQDPTSEAAQMAARRRFEAGQQLLPGMSYQGETGTQMPQMNTPQGQAMMQQYLLGQMLNPLQRAQTQATVSGTRRAEQAAPLEREALGASIEQTQTQTQRSKNLLPGDMERQRIENKRTRQAIRLAEKESNLTSQTIKKRMALIDKELGSADLEKKYTQARIDHYNALAKDMQKRRKSDENTVRYRMLTDKLNAAVKAYSDNRELDPDVMEWVVSDPDLDAQARATIKTTLSELDQLQSNIYGKKKGKGAAGSLPEYQENPLNLNMNNLSPLRK